MKHEVSLLYKFGFLIVLLLVIFGFMLPVAVALSNNAPSSEIPNGGFEDGTLEPWWAPVRVSPERVEKLNSSMAARHVEITEERVHNGSYALKIFNLTEDIETLPYFGVVFRVPMSWLQSKKMMGYRLSLWASTGDFNDTIVPNSQVLQWVLGIGIYCTDENDRVIFYTLWNPSRSITNMSSPPYWCDEWKNVVVDIPGDTAIVIISVYWKMAELVPPHAKIYIDDVDLTPYTIIVRVDRPTYYLGDINLLAFVPDYKGSSPSIEIDAFISKRYIPLSPGEFTPSTHGLTVTLKMYEKGPGVYGASWPVPMRWTLIGPYDVTFVVKAQFRNWPDGITYNYGFELSTSFTVIPLIPIVMSAILIGTIIITIVKSKWMRIEIFILLILLLILLLY